MRISEAEMRVFLDEQIAKLDDLTRPTWKKHKVPLQTATVQRSGGAPEPAFILARAGDQVLLYDDVADQFATGPVDADGVARKWTTHGEELRAALKYFRP